MSPLHIEHNGACSSNVELDGSPEPMEESAKEPASSELAATGVFYNNTLNTDKPHDSAQNDSSDVHSSDQRTLIVTLKVGQSRSMLREPTHLSMDKDYESSASSMGLSYRQLIGMALLDAQNSPLSSSDIKDWITNAYPEYHKGQGKWESGISAILSQNRDFRREKRHGERSSAWSFKSAKTRDMYAKELLTFRPKCGSSGSNKSTARAADSSSPSYDTQNRSASPPGDKGEEKVVDSLEGITAPGPDGEASVGSEINSSKMETTILDLTREDDEKTQRMPWDGLSGDSAQPEVANTDFFLAFPEYRTEPTPQQREKKRLEIKKRLSRKATFDQVVVHARRNRRRPHEEVMRAGCGRQGRHQVPSATSGTNQIKGGWSDVLELPQNPIPIVYEGQLSFREGVLVRALRSACDCWRR